jgi:hypothetical protein
LRPRLPLLIGTYGTSAAGAPQLVADVLGLHRHVLPPLFESVLDLPGEQAIKPDIGQPDVSVLDPLDFRHSLAQFVLRQAQADALSEHRHRERAAVRNPRSLIHYVIVFLES